MINYIVVNSNDQIAFPKTVSELLSQGYKCEGGVSVLDASSGRWHFQALTKEI